MRRLSEAELAVLNVLWSGKRFNLGQVVGRNPQTGKEIKIAAANVPAFVSGKALKDAVK